MRASYQLYLCLGECYAQDGNFSSELVEFALNLGLEDIHSQRNISKVSKSRRGTLIVA